MILYPLFYRRNGMRRINDLTHPLLHSITTFEFPFDTIFHYIGEGMADFGIPDTDPLFREYHKAIMVDHVLSLPTDANIGNPRHTSIQPSSLIRDYHRKNRRTRPLRSLSTTLRDRTSLVMVNYAFLPHLYRYTTNAFSNYYTWANIHSAVWDKANAIATETTRQQYIFVALPQLLPPLPYLLQGGKAPVRTVVTHMQDSNALSLFDIATWIGDHREHSVMNRLHKSSYDKLNLVFTNGGRWFVINLGIMDSWRQETMKEKAEEEAEGIVPVHHNGNTISATLLQRRFLRAIITLFEASTAGLTDVVVDAAAEKALDKGDETEEDDSKTHLDAELDDNPEDSDVIVSKRMEEPHVDMDAMSDTEKGKLLAPLPEDNGIDVERQKEMDRVQDLAAHEDLHELIQMSERLADEHLDANNTAAYVPTETKPEDGVYKAAAKMADLGVLSVAEYRRMVEMATRYKTLPDPTHKSATLAEGLVIDPKDLLPGSAALAPEIKGVTDPSLLNSSLKTLTSQYVEKVMHKDIMGAVVSMQAAGIAVYSYDIEKVHDVQDEYEIHTVRFVPVTGKPSTVRFRLPSVRPDGTYMVGGVRNIFRSQRIDVPIRKIAPDRVALTSYYSKMFVYRSERKANSYEDWILNYITRAGSDRNDDTVTHLMLSECFNPDLQVPRIYSILSKRFSKFTAEGIVFCIDWNEREAFFGKERIEAFDKKPYPKRHPGKITPIGLDKKNRLIGVGFDNVLYIVNNDDPADLEDMGTLEILLKMPLEKKPIEFVELGIFAKAIPLGFVLGAHLGLGTLLKLLSASPRWYSAGERYVVNENEFPLRFKDGTYVVSMDKKNHEFLLGGFLKYHRDLRRYSSKEFNKPDVYGTILERNGLGARFSREIELMFAMFIDPITLEILKEMGEPTDLVQLLLEASQMLETDDSPHPMDMRYMRDRGYERFAGAVYTEMVRAIRNYKSRAVTSMASVDLNPYAVWQSILQDPAGMPVQDRNPIQNLREKEVVVFAGNGGRSSRSMTGEARIFHKTALGVTSESTSDSSDVATVIFAPPDPNYKSVRGLTRTLDKKDGPSKLLSTSALLAPGSDIDD